MGPLSRGLLLFLWALTALALLPWEPQGPFDPRSGAKIAGLTLDYPLWVAAIEPLVAPLRVIAGAPDYRVAMVECAAWLVAGAMAWSATRPGAGRGWRALSAGAGALLLAVVYLAAAVLVPVPGWRLTAQDPELVIADLQSHTAGSGDAFVTPAESLAWHARQGYQLFAVSEHQRPDGSFRAREAVRALSPATGLIPGVEVRADEEEYLLALGLKEGRPSLREGNGRPGYVQRFVRDVHEGHGGAVIALNWDLTPALVEKLAAAGVDGFELVNAGHPELAPEVRAAILRVARERGLVLVGSSDWHGWGGESRAYTVVRLPGAAAMDGEARAAALVRLLRERSPAVTPVVAGRLGAAPRWRALLAPLLEPVRYAAELSPARVAGWWLWGGIAWLAAAWWRAGGGRPGRLFYALGLLIPALALLVRAAQLGFVRDLAGGRHPFAVEVAGYAAAIGLVGLGVAFGLLWRERRRAARSAGVEAPA